MENKNIKGKKLITEKEMIEKRVSRKVNAIFLGAFMIPVCFVSGAFANVFGTTMLESLSIFVGGVGVLSSISMFTFGLPLAFAMDKKIEKEVEKEVNNSNNQNSDFNKKKSKSICSIVSKSKEISIDNRNNTIIDNLKSYRNELLSLNKTEEKEKDLKKVK